MKYYSIIFSIIFSCYSYSYPMSKMYDIGSINGEYINSVNILSKVNLNDNVLYKNDISRERINYITIRSATIEKITNGIVNVKINRNEFSLLLSLKLYTDGKFERKINVKDVNGNVSIYSINYKKNIELKNIAPVRIIYNKNFRDSFELKFDIESGVI